MKKIILNAIFLTTLLSSFSSHGQLACSQGTLYPADPLSWAGCDQTGYDLITNAWAGEYSTLNVEVGQVYQFISSDTGDYHTITNQDGSQVLAYGGGGGRITWYCSATGIVRWYLHANESCGTEDINRTRRIACGSQQYGYDNCYDSTAIALDANVLKTGATNYNTTSTESINCASGFIRNDIWYIAQANSSGYIRVRTLPAIENSVADTVLALYTGSCGALTEVGCNDDIAGSSNTFSDVTVTGLVPNEQVKVRVGRYNDTVDGNFLIESLNPLAATTFETNNFKAYPNPIKDVLNLSFDKNISNVAVFNLLGQDVLTKSVNSNQTQIDFSNLASGTYLLKVTADNQVKTIKVMKE